MSRGLQAKARHSARLLARLSMVVLAADAHAQSEPRTNFFDDPFVQATGAMARCPAPEGPLYSAAEARAQAHVRIEKGTTCHYHGRCRLPNAYLYDKEIIPRVARFIRLDDRFKDSSIWLVGQRRWVHLQGCVASRAQADELVREIKLIDDVEAVVDQTMVGESGPPPYPSLREKR